MAFVITAIAFILFTLGGVAWAAWNPVSRPQLNRVSFRFLVYALVAKYAMCLSARTVLTEVYSMIYAISMIGGTKLTVGAACNFNAFFANVRERSTNKSSTQIFTVLQSSLMFAGIMFSSIALSLQYVE